VPSAGPKAGPLTGFYNDATRPSSGPASIRALAGGEDKTLEQARSPSGCAALACAALGAGTEAGAAAAPRACRGANLYPSATNARIIDAATLCLVNRLRLAHHAGPLRPNRELRQVAASQVTNMVRWDYFADVRPTGQTPLTLVAASRYAAHTVRIAVGQNLAWGTDAYATPAHIVAEWMASPPHREVMLSDEYRDAGVAAMSASPAVVGAGGQGATYAVEFGARL
jgi:uncharacterized protein YkwD